MHRAITDFFIYSGVAPGVAFWASVAIMALIMLACCSLANFVAKKLISSVIYRLIKKSQTSWDDVLYENRVFSGLSHIAPALVMIGFAQHFPVLREQLSKFALIYISAVGYVTFDRFADSVDCIYKTYEVSREKPITSYLQVAKILAIIVCVIIAVGIVIEQSPWALISGIGALTAVLMVIFKDSIMGLSAGIQLSVNKMLHIGDWVEMPKYGADGEVIEITLNTVKVQNWDKTIIMIPIYSMISEPFKNWRGMFVAGGRRIKRSIFIDATSVRFADAAAVERYMSDARIRPFIEHYVASGQAEGEYTNIGIFRNYACEYLNRHSRIEKSMRMTARQLQPTESGIPVEVYAFCRETDWTVYEGVQAGIVEHLIAIAPRFDLKVFQRSASSASSYQAQVADAQKQ